VTDPRAALIAAGGVLREGEMVKVVENTGELVHLILPARPPGELSDEALEEVVAGTAACWIASPHLPTLENLERISRREWQRTETHGVPPGPRWVGSRAALPQACPRPGQAKPRQERRDLEVASNSPGDPITARASTRVIFRETL
jgi:hypothetical protein